MACFVCPSKGFWSFST